MATSGELVNAMSAALGIPQATVALYDRALSEAGIRTKGGRGRSAAHMTSLDAANLLVAIVASPVTGPAISSAVDHWRQYAGLSAGDGTSSDRTEERRFSSRLASWLGRASDPMRDLRNTSPHRSGRYQLDAVPLDRLKSLPANHTLADGVAAIIDSARDGSLKEALGISNTAAKTPAEVTDRAWKRGLLIMFAAPDAQVAIELWNTAWKERLVYGEEPSLMHLTTQGYAQLRYVYSRTLFRLADALDRK